MSPSSISVPRYGLIAPNASGAAELWVTGSSGIRMFTGDQNPKFNILTNGNVGIGISNPESKLDIGTNTGQKTFINYQNKSAVTFIPNLGSWFHISTSDGAYNDLTISQGASVNENRLLTIKPNGDVKIGGTGDPVAKLDVSGNAKFNSSGEYTFLTLGQEANDQLIVDNTSAKSYGGGYFFRVHNQTATNQYVDALMIGENGNVGIGVNPPQNKLDVAGKSSFSDNMKVNAKIEAKEIKVTQIPTADFVFEENYGLPKLEEVEKYVKENKHLPEVASAREMEKEGVNVGEFQIKLLQKIEELTLYTIEQNKELQKLKAEISELKSK